MADPGDETIVDVAFRLPGGRLPVDHAYALFSAISDALPWFEDEASARLHQVHTAATGSGWMRPEASPDDELHLSRRTKLRVRVPERRAADTLALAGREMDVAGYSLTPSAGKVVVLMPADTLLARHVVCEEGEQESRLVARLTETLADVGVNGATLFCGRAHRIVTPQAVLHTRSVVVSNLDPGGAMSLLRTGIGPAGKLGCGIFIPYKHID
jgi:CRISPR-associated protein Cas6